MSQSVLESYFSITGYYLMKCALCQRLYTICQHQVYKYFVY